MLFYKPLQKLLYLVGSPFLCSDLYMCTCQILTSITYFCAWLALLQQSRALFCGCWRWHTCVAMLLEWRVAFQPDSQWSSISVGFLLHHLQILESGLFSNIDYCGYEFKTTKKAELKPMYLNLQESPLINLLGQTSSLPWQLVGISSYQSIISYCNSHYPPSVVLAKDAAAELIVKLLKVSAGFGTSSDSHIHLVSWTAFAASQRCSCSLRCSAFVCYRVWKEL